MIRQSWDLRPSYLYYGNPYTSKTASLCLDGPLDTVLVKWCVFQVNGFKYFSMHQTYPPQYFWCLFLDLYKHILHYISAMVGSCHPSIPALSAILENIARRPTWRDMTRSLIATQATTVQAGPLLRHHWLRHMEMSVPQVGTIWWFRNSLLPSKSCNKC